METFRYPWSESHQHDLFQSPYQQGNHPHAAPKHFEAILDAGSDIVDLAECLRTQTSIESVRVHIHDSFSGRLPSEVLVLFEALGTRPQLTKLFLGFHRRHYARLPLQALSLALIQASRLTTLEVRGLQLDGTQSDFTTLAASLQNHPSLEEIKISNCQIPAHTSASSPDNYSDNDEHSAPLDALVRALTTISSLRRINIQSSTQDSLGKIKHDTLGLLCQATNNLHAIGLLGFTFDEQHLISLSNGLCSGSSSSSSSLKELYLGNIRLGTQGDAALARILQRPQQQPQADTNDGPNNHLLVPTTSLEYLDLQFQDFESPVEIALALVHNTTLRHFFVHGNLTSISQQTFARAIQHNYYLKSLELMNGSVHLAEIRFYLSMNTLGRAQLLLEGTNNMSNSHEWVDKLISQRDNVSALFYLLSMNPLLCNPDHS
jgi:hypothetical protein